VGIGARLARVGRFVTGAVARVAGRTRVTWRVAGVVDRFVACCCGVAWLVKGFVPGTVAIVAGGKARTRFIAAVVRVAKRIVAVVIRAC
jgi:hypothetical protein